MPTGLINVNNVDRDSKKYSILFAMIFELTFKLFRLKIRFTIF